MSATCCPIKNPSSPTSSVSTSDAINDTVLKLFIKGLATRPFQPALRLMVGEETPLSPSTISRLTRQFREA